MINRFFLCLSIVFITSVSSAPVKGAEFVQDEPRVFTNQDIEKYKSPSDAKPAPAKTVLKEDREDSGKDKKKRIMEEREMEYWCKRASTCNRRIEDGKEAIKEIKDEIFEAKTEGRYSHKKNTMLEKKLESAKKRLRKVEGDLNDLEQEAHRKGVKPGWLRCQFE